MAIHYLKTILNKLLNNLKESVSATAVSENIPIDKPTTPVEPIFPQFTTHGHVYGNTPMQVVQAIPAHMTNNTPQPNFNQPQTHSRIIQHDGDTYVFIVQN